MSPPPKLLPVLERIKFAYKIWHSYTPTISKEFRYSIVESINKYFLQIIENILIASFLQRQEKRPFVRKAIISLDVLKFFLYTLWELSGLDTKKYIALSEPLAEAGKMLGGWNGQLEKQEKNIEKKNP